MSRSVTVRHVPDDAVEELAARAARSGQSLQEYLRGHLIELAERPDVAHLMARARARKDATGSRLPVASILGHRERDRR
jgi:plasmid stability protein